jgi:hypothetical protein
MADPPSRDADQPVPRGADLGIAAADAVAQQLVGRSRGRAELVQPARGGGRDQSPSPSGGVGLGRSLHEHAELSPGRRPAC